MSIQFLPAYCVALPARLLRISTATTFILLTPISAFLLSLAVFCLVGHVTRNNFVAAASVLLVLCLGSIARGQWLIALLCGSPQPPIPFPFLRRYEPAIPLPIFFVFCFLLWKVVNGVHARRYIASACLTFGVLVFSYFFLWTAALALLVSLLLVVAVVRPAGYPKRLRHLGVLAATCSIPILAFGLLIRQTDEGLAAHTVITFTRAPDFRPISIFSLSLLIVLLLAIRKKLVERNTAVIFTVALAVAPFLMLNQQVVTGRSVQPQHYELFVANYLILVTIALAFGLLIPRLYPRSLGTLLLAISVFSVIVAVSEGSFASTSRVSITVDEFMPVAERLANLNAKPSEIVLILHPALDLPDLLPSVATVSVLWAPHTFAFAGLNNSQIKERYFQHLYYANLNLEQEGRFSYARIMFRRNIFGWERTIPGLRADWQPVTIEEEETALREYARFASTFNQRLASNPKLAFVITSTKTPSDLSRIDLWYERDAGEQVGDFVLYNVKPRF